MQKEPKNNQDDFFEGEIKDDTITLNDSDEDEAASPNEPVKAPKQKSKKGVITLFFVILLTVLGLAGWKWYGQITEYQNKQNEADQQISQLEKQVADLKTGDNDIFDENKESAKYLVVKEWGVKLASTSSPMTYKITKNSDGSETAWFTNESAQALRSKAVSASCNDESSDGTPNHWYLASIHRSDKKITEGAYGYTEPIVIDGRYYYVENANGICTSEADSQTEATIMRSLKSSVETVQVL